MQPRVYHSLCSMFVTLHMTWAIKSEFSRAYVRCGAMEWWIESCLSRRGTVAHNNDMNINIAYTWLNWKTTCWRRSIICSTRYSISSQHEMRCKEEESRTIFVAFILIELNDIAVFVAHQKYPQQRGIEFLTVDLQLSRRTSESEAAIRRRRGRKK